MSTRDAAALLPGRDPDGPCASTSSDVQRAVGVTPIDWATLAAQGEAQALGDAWLAWLSQRVPGIQRSVVLLDNGGGTLSSVAVRPVGSAIEYLKPWVVHAAGTGQPLSQERPDAPGRWVLAVPLVIDSHAGCIVALELNNADEALRHFALSVVQGALGWWLSCLTQRTHGQAHEHLQQARQLFDLTLAVMSQPGFDDAALAWANGLAKHTDASEVLLAWAPLSRPNQARLIARSGAAWHDQRAGLVEQAEQAMNEAMDEGAPVSWSRTSASPADATGLARYAAHTRAGAIAVIPLRDDAHAVGALLLARDAPITPQELEALTAQTLLLTPLLALKREVQRGLWSHAQVAIREALEGLTGSSRPGLKLALSTAAVALLMAAVWPVSYRVAAPAVVEGEVQRAAVAPFQGYIREAFVRAGDTVKRGQALALLEDKDLTLEQRRWEAELEMATRKEREAMASGNRVDQRLASAQANQARAQLDLAQDRLQRVRITAPFDGVVVRGDLSQQLGSPVEQGKLLFELAPLDAWRVILKVDERDVAYVHSGQTGEVVLASLPGTARTVTVQRVTSVAVAEEGRNHFRVEAALQGPLLAGSHNNQAQQPLRPGMEGVAKVQTDSRSLLWVATHRLVDWLRLTLWELAP